MTESHWTEMRDHVDSCAPFEACGLLAGEGETVQQILLVANQENSTSRFRMHPAEQLRAFRLIDEGHLELLGIFHSHPAGPGSDLQSMSRPSPTDIAEAAYPVVHIIWSMDHGLWRARGFSIEDGRVSSVQLRVAT